MAQATRTFRIFVSSTFSDLREERNALQRHVFPRLKQLCLAHGTRFQAIDLRWGVREEAGLDQRTMRICLDEIERCRRASPRPNFVVLLGDRYGWRPLPAVIPASEFERLTPHITPGDDADLVEAWYVRDDNAVPPEYYLKPREVETREEQTKEEREAIRKAEANRWAEEEASLRRILTAAVARASFSEEDRIKYEASATAQEIHNGALKVSDARKHVFCYFRQITNMDDLVRDLPADLPEEDRAKNFIDTRKNDPPDPDGRDVPDADARASLDRLEAALEDRLPGNVHRYKTRWMGGRGAPHADVDARCQAVVEALVRGLAEAVKEANAARGSVPGQAEGDRETVDLDASAWERLRRLKDEQVRNPSGASEPSEPEVERRPPVITLDHLPELCADVLLDLTRVILTEIARLEERDPLEKEIDDNEAFSQDRAKVFIGRARLLKVIAAYAAGGTNQPRAVHGASGSGKSALMARGAMDVRAAHPAATLVQRFIGATPGSSDIRTLLDGLCRQISRAYDADETTIPTDYRELVQELPKRLALADAARPLVIFLDALDQLSDADHARNLIWLPGSLPDHVRVIVSTLPGECLSALERKLARDSMVELEPMPVEEASELLDLWLTSAARTLQPDQRREVLEKFAQSSLAEQPAETGDRRRGGLPLYLKLAFEESRRWTATGRHKPLSTTVPGIIRDLFERLSDDANHGAMMVSRSLAYLAAGKSGLSEDELLDVLTADDEAYGDFEVRARHAPPERRLPVVVWSRLFFDLEPYLTERAADGASLLAFYHRQLREVVEADYLAGPASADAIERAAAKAARHATLARYFAGRKIYEDEGAPNVRMLSELPYQQTHGEQWDALYATLTDFEFLEAKCTHVGVVAQGRGPDARKIYGGVYELQEDYRRALEHFPAV